MLHTHLLLKSIIADPNEQEQNEIAKKMKKAKNMKGDISIYISIFSILFKLYLIDILIRVNFEVPLRGHNLSW
ncbi:unnamed protein product [Blepharisma stoltei]|uniref:Uncharacterized protein n=1 Tax=Blepharisma stoltei TaxID=1481888 RepID=A0AAU9JZZ8_9CILI|nr:unnamed protein product [Blepharisma stoltei]